MCFLCDGTCDELEPKPELAALARRINDATDLGMLHIVLSDGNIEDEHLRMELQRPGIPPEEASLAADMLAISEDDREIAMCMALNQTF